MAHLPPLMLQAVAFCSSTSAWQFRARAAAHIPEQPQTTPCPGEYHPSPNITKDKHTATDSTLSVRRVYELRVRWLSVLRAWQVSTLWTAGLRTSCKAGLHALCIADIHAL